MKWSVVRPLRIAVLDDHSLIQLALELRLTREADFKVVGVYSNSRELLESLSESEVDLLVLDYVLGDNELDGLNLLSLFSTLSSMATTAIFSCRKPRLRRSPYWRARLPRCWENPITLSSR